MGSLFGNAQERTVGSHVQLSCASLGIGHVVFLSVQDTQSFERYCVSSFCIGFGKCLFTKNVPVVEKPKL